MFGQQTHQHESELVYPSTASSLTQQGGQDFFPPSMVKAFTDSMLSPVTDDFGEEEQIAQNAQVSHPYTQSYPQRTQDEQRYPIQQPLDDFISDPKRFEHFFGKRNPGEKTCCRSTPTPTLLKGMTEEYGLATEAKRFGSLPGSGEGEIDRSGQRNYRPAFAEKHSMAPITDFGIRKESQDSEDQVITGLPDLLRQLPQLPLPSGVEGTSRESESSGATAMPAKSGAQSESLPRLPKHVLEQLGLEIIPGQSYYHTAVFREHVAGILRDQEIKITSAKAARDLHFQRWTDLKKNLDETDIALQRLKQQKLKTLAIQELIEQNIIRKMLLQI